MSESHSSPVQQSPPVHVVPACWQLVMQRPVDESHVNGDAHFLPAHSIP